MHIAITKAFKRYHLFGFTGTPIFAENAGTGGNPQLRTTEQAFGDRLHTYTIVDAINDKNVLPFRIDYVNTIKLPADLDRQAGLRDRHRAGAARARADRPGRRLHPRALRPEDQAQLSLHARRASGSRASTRCSPPPRSTPRSATTPSSRGSRPSCRRSAAAQGRARSTATPRTRTIDDDFLDEEEFETERPRRKLARLPRGRDPGLQRDVRHELRHLVRQVPELLQGPLAATEEPRARPRDRRQHVPDRLRRDHAQHALGRQEPPRARPDPGVLAHQPDPQLRQDLRQHRHLPRPGGADERRARALRQQGRPRHRPAQAVRRLLRRVRRARRRAAGALPARRADASGRARPKMFIAALRGDPAAAEHPDRRSTSSPATRSSASATTRTTSALPRPLRRVPPRRRLPRRSRSSTTSSSRSSSSSRSRSTSTTS